MFVIVHYDPGCDAIGPFDTREEAIQYCVEEWEIPFEEVDDGVDFWIAEVTK